MRTPWFRGSLRSHLNQRRPVVQEIAATSLVEEIAATSLVEEIAPTSLVEEIAPTSLVEEVAQRPSRDPPPR
ncbi:hypothetical protein [Nocardioides pelophilus]|uniref:hypothetical protein n=1 Tax=Nocardioides pelophilus TaxID=2172019 RepID=UPI0016002DA4|nr:hypothetical protein [Nocardioides pelophilus]